MPHATTVQQEEGGSILLEVSRESGNAFLVSVRVVGKMIDPAASYVTYPFQDIESNPVDLYRVGGRE